MSNYENCSGSCDSCGNCGGTCMSGALFLTKEEIKVLELFAEIPFWPLGRHTDSENPICHEDGMTTAALTNLSLKGLIQLDFDFPLDNFDYSDYQDCNHLGSMALTTAGQHTIDLLDIQGIEV